MRRIAPIAAALAAALALALPAGANANAVSKIFHRCSYGESIGGFSVHAYREALREIETEMVEYSECAELIVQAELAAARNGRHGHGRQSKSGSVTPGSVTSGSGSGPGSGSPSNAESAIGNQPIPVSPAEDEAVQKAQRNGSGAVQIGPTGAGGAASPTPIQPGVVNADLASAASSIPAPLLAILALLAALAIAAASRMIFLYARRQRQQL